MGNLTRPRLVKSLLAITFVGFQLGCTEVKFKSTVTEAQTPQGVAPGAPSTPVLSPTPTPPPCVPEILHIPTKVLFVVDMSSSNQGVSFGSKYSPGSDDNKVMRAGVISTFLEHYQNNANFSWGFITFNDSTAKNIISGLPKNQIFTNNPNKMHDAIQYFQRQSDQGETPYQAALSLVYKGLANDPDLGLKEKANYIIVFLSDGVPTDYSSDLAGQKKLMADVRRIFELSPEKITFNAVYYGPTNPSASTRLKQMSLIGKGLFLDTNLNPAGKDFDIEDVIEIPKTCE